ncbi:MAG: O-antigen ligase family protein [Candidatus Cloacimonetes bacterium]|nr:O-antigen ligase family protein [Candidatus Cloacimonadota bacterium]
MKIKIAIIQNIEFIIFLMMIIFLLPLTFLHRTIDPVMTIRTFILSFSLLLVLFIVILKNRYYYKAVTIFRKKIFLYIGINFLFSLSSLFVAINVPEAGHGLVKVVLIYLFFITTALLLAIDTGRIILLIRSIAVIIFLFFIVGTVQFFASRLYSIPGHQIVYSLFANRNLFASALFLGLPFTLYCFFCDSRFWRLLAALNFTGSIFCIIIVRARAVWLASLAAGFVVIMLFLISQKWHKIPVRIRNPRIIILAVLLIFSLLLVFISSRIPDIRKRNVYLFSKSLTEPANLLLRYQAWEKTVKMIGENPLLGVGLNNWKIVFPKYGLQATKVESGAYQYIRPHNDYLWVASETGIPGFAAYLMIFLTGIIYTMRILFRSQEEKEKIYALCSLYGIIGYMVIAFFSFPWERVYHSILLFSNLAVLTVLSDKHKPSGGKVGSRPLFLLMIIVSLTISIAACYYNYHRLKSEVHNFHAFLTNRARDHEKTVVIISRIDTRFMNMTHNGIPILWFRGNANFQLLRLIDAYRDFLAAYRNHPYHVYVMNNLATCHEIMGNRDKAIELYYKVLDISPAFEETLVNLSQIYYSNNELVKAYRILYRSYPGTRNPRIREMKRKIYWKLLASNPLEENSND